MTKEMSILKIQKPNTIQDWWRLYKLYLAAFPAAERKPFSMIVSMYRKGKTDIWCVRSDGKFAGLAITINGPDIILLDYFAILKNCRGEGIGTKALSLLRDHYSGKGFFVEIETTLKETPELPMRLRRKKFYLAAGLQELSVTAKLFGVDMELLGSGCTMDYARYKAFYRDNYNQWAADHIEP